LYYLFTIRAPVAVKLILNAANGAAASGNVLTNDSDPDGDTLSVVAQNLTTANGSQIVLNADGSFTLQAALGFRGNDSFTYTIQDSYGAQSSTTVTVDNLFTNRAPVAVNDIIDAQHQGTATGNVLTNDSDPDGDSFTAFMEDIFTAHDGHVVVETDGTFTYTAAAGFMGNDSFSYTINDGYGGQASAIVNVLDIFTNRAPVAQDDTIDGHQQTIITGNVLADNGNGADSDPDGDAFHVVAQTLTTATGGLMSIDATGAFTYVAAKGYQGTDSFTYTLQDSFGASSTGAVTVNAIYSSPLVTPDIVTEHISVFADISEVYIPHDFRSYTPEFPVLKEGVRPASVNGVDPYNVTLRHDQDVSVNFVSQGTKTGDTFGYYTIDATGHIANVHILAKNMSDAALQKYGLLADLGMEPAGTQFGFFIITDGLAKNKDFSGLDLEHGSLMFVNKGSGAASAITDTLRPPRSGIGGPGWHDPYDQWQYFPHRQRFAQSGRAGACRLRYQCARQPADRL